MEDTEQKIITGIVKQGDVEAVFYGNDFQFIFTPVVEMSEDKIHKIRYEHSDMGKIRPVDNFIRGTLVDGSTILIYCGSELSLDPTCSIDTDIYIIGKDSFDSCDSIRFKGGSVNSIFIRNAVHMGPIEENPEGETVQTVTYKNNERIIKHTPENEKDIIKDFHIFSNARASRSCTDGSHVGDTDAEFTVDFNSSQPVGNKIPETIENVRKMINFLTYRSYADFDHVYIEKNITGPHKGPSVIGECFLKRQSNEKSRDTFNCLSFDMLTDENIDLIYKTIKDMRLDFIPESGNTATQTDEQKIKDICTATEIEAEAEGIKVHAHAREYDNLLKQMKTLITNGRSSGILTDKEFNYLSSSVSNLYAPAAERAYELYKKHQKEIESVLCFFGKTADYIDEEKIHKVIKARNELTHAGSSAVFYSDNEIGIAAIMTICAIYAGILDRCKVDSDIARDLFTRGFIINKK